MYIRREATVGRSRKSAALTDDERTARMVAAKYWHLLRTAWRRTDDARYFLEDMGVAVAQPMAKRWVRAGGFKVRQVPVRAQAFDGYLFLGVLGRGVMWQALHETGLFRGVVGLDGRPARLTGEQVQMVMFRADTGDFDEEAPGRLAVNALKAGDMAKIVDHGGFTGLTVKVDAVGELTARVLVTMLGKANMVEMPLGKLAKVREGQGAREEGKPANGCETP